MWNDLNARQQAYLTAIYEVDQEQEEDERQRFRLGATTRSADVWRWMDYATFDGIHTPLKMNIFLRNLQDEGTGSTFEALEARLLIRCRYTNATRNGEPVLGDAILAVQITKEGRKLVRQGLKIAPGHRCKGELTKAQRRYADAIIEAGLAPREEVEAAFRDHRDEHISSWGYALKRRAEEAYRERLRSLARQESCAYPGCPKQIAVHKGRSEFEEDEYPQPARTITISYEVQRWEENALGSKQRVECTEWITRRLYACCEKHREGIFRLKVVDVVLALDEAEEQRIQSIQYPIEASQEARWKVIELARNTALNLVAQADDQDCINSPRKIKALAEQQLSALLAASDPTTLTDSLELFQEMYRKQFYAGYRDGLRIRQAILEQGNQRMRNDPRWQLLYERRDEWLMRQSL